MTSYRQPRTFWTPEEDSLLRGWWDAGVVVAEIAKRLDRNRDMVIGRARRLKLPPRPSPIIGDKMASARKAADTRRRNA